MVREEYFFNFLMILVQYPCGSEPARDSGVTVNIDVGCNTAIASRLAPTGFGPFAAGQIRGGFRSSCRL
ncbi:hypothetical protein FPT12_20170 [Pseudomonas sp. H3(2019)]|nr:hypothetical protein FPT12_20170 [Pseudomonas sp. H3(2019)]